MGSDGLQVALDQVTALAGQWQTLSAQLTSLVPPQPGPAYQPTTAAVSTVNAGIGVASSSLVARTQATAGGAVKAAEGYGKQEATNATDMSGVTQGVTVV